jgi:hypothetical protein
MSTRATYLVNGTPFYIHTDGYPEGAAEYFRQMIGALTAPAADGLAVGAIADRRGGLVHAFIRGNDRAEPTESHQAHGDTKYRWDVDDRRPEAKGEILVRCQARRYDFDGWGAWSTWAPIEELIGRHYPGAIVAIVDPDRYMGGRKILATIGNALAIARRELEIAGAFQDGNPPNKPGHQALATAWLRGVIEQLPARVSFLEKQAAACRAELAKGSTWGRDYYERELAEIEEELEELREPLPDNVDVDQAPEQLGLAIAN